MFCAGHFGCLRWPMASWIRVAVSVSSRGPGGRDVPHVRTMTSMLTDGPKPPTPTCPPAQVGPCAACGHPTQRYGSKGCPLCVVCLVPVLARQAKKTPAG